MECRQNPSGVCSINSFTCCLMYQFSTQSNTSLAGVLRVSSLRLIVSFHSIVCSIVYTATNRDHRALKDPHKPVSQVDLTLLEIVYVIPINTRTNGCASGANCYPRILLNLIEIWSKKMTMQSQIPKLKNLQPALPISRAFSALFQRPPTCS